MKGSFTFCECCCRTFENEIDRVGSGREGEMDIVKNQSHYILAINLETSVVT